MMVLSRWATVMIVQSQNLLLMVFWMRSSVSRSTAAVASSNTRIFVLRRRARARHTNWRWPTLEAKKSNENRTYNFWSFTQDSVPLPLTDAEVYSPSQRQRSWDEHSPTLATPGCQCMSWRGQGSSSASQRRRQDPIVMITIIILLLWATFTLEASS